MSKAVLTLDDINLLINSEEPKNEKLYGNLYDSLIKLTVQKAVTLEQMPFLDEKGKAAIAYNKNTLIKTTIQEWYTESIGVEDSSKKVRCALCNTPNKYLFYIRNRHNNIILNVGSRCITKFPEIEGYTEQKQQLRQIQKGRSIVIRRTEFYNHFQDVEQLIAEADSYFSTLPILLPYDLYTKLQDTITRMRLIFSLYVNEGKKPFESIYDSFKLFQLALDQYNTLRECANTHISKKSDKSMICKRREIDWLIKNSKQVILQRISENEGVYTIDTLKHIHSMEFVKDNLEQISSKNQSTLFKFIKFNENGILMSYNKIGYQPPFTFSISLNKLMHGIGASCIFDSTFSYGGKHLLDISELHYSTHNLTSIINYTYNIMKKLGCTFLIDESTDSLMIYRNGDRAIRSFASQKFLETYGLYILSSDEVIKEWLFSIIQGSRDTKWVSPEEQAKRGTYDKINKIYKEQSIDTDIFYDRRSKNFEIILYNINQNASNKKMDLDFDSPEYLNIPKEKIKLNSNDLKYVDYAIRVTDNSLEPKYHKGDLLLIHNTQTVKDGNTIFFVYHNEFITKTCHTVEGYDNIFNHIGIKKNALQAYGKIVYCLKQI